MHSHKKPVSGSSRLFFSVLAGLCGAGLLVLMFPRRGPWELVNIVLKLAGSGGSVEFRFPGLGSFSLDYYLTVLLLVGLLPASAFFFPAVRAAAARLFRGDSSRPALCIALLLIGTAYIAGFFVPEKIVNPRMLVRSVTLYLTFGLYGTALLFASVAGLTADLALWSRLRNFVLGARVPLFLATLVCAEFFLTNLISYFAFEHLPHIQDSFAQVFQGNIFAHGQLTAPSPPVRGLFWYEHIINNGRWYSQYPPGHSFLMMFGVLAGMPWIVNPLLGSATVVAMYYLGRELYGDRLGRLSALLTVVSPFILFMSSEFMNHASGLLLFTLFALFFARAVKRRSIAAALLAGAALGWLENIRPLTAATLALPFCLYAGLLLLKNFRKHAPTLIAMAAPALLLTMVLLGYNYLTNGDPLLFGYQALHGSEHLPGFGHAAWGEPHTLRRGIEHALSNLAGLNKYLFEWPIPSLAFVIALFASGRANRWDGLLIGSFLCLALGYLAYWYQDWCFGPRYLYEASGCMILLTARGVQSMPSLVKKLLGRTVPVMKTYGILTAVLVFCCAYGLITNGPALYKLYSRSYWGMDGKLIRAVEQKNPGKAIIFIRDRDYLMPNSPFLDTDIIYAWDPLQKLGSDALRKQLMAHYPDHRYFLAEHNNITEIFP